MEFDEKLPSQLQDALDKGLLNRLPITFLPVTRQQLREWEYLFPYERQSILHLLLYLASLSEAQSAALFQEVVQLEEKMGANLNQLGAQLRSEFQHGFDHLAESIHDSETRLLKAFYTFAESNQQRLSQVEGNTTAVIARLATLESRIIEVEKRLNMPPAA